MDLHTKTKQLLEHAITAKRIRPEHAKGMLDGCHNWSQYGELVKLANAEDGFPLTAEEVATCERLGVTEDEFRSELVAEYRARPGSFELPQTSSADEVQRAIAFCQAEKASR